MTGASASCGRDLCRSRCCPLREQRSARFQGWSWFGGVSSDRLTCSIALALRGLVRVSEKLAYECSEALVLFCPIALAVRLFVMPLQQVFTKVLVEVSIDTVNMVGVVLSIVIFE